jgi:hypothetical protein
MKPPSVQSLVAIVLVGLVPAAQAAEVPIGIAVAGGQFRVDRAEVNGNASVFDGSEVSTSAASSKVRLNNGVRLELGAQSQFKVFGTHALLEQGAGQIQGGSRYRIEARELRVAPESKSIARVRLDGSGGVLVSALRGPVKVSNASGMMLARLAPGRSLHFQQAAVPDSYEVTGCLLKKMGRAVILDQTTDQVLEVRGIDDSTEFGNRVTIKGKSVALLEPVEGATVVITAQSVTRVAPGGCLAAASAIGADSPGPTSVTPGTSGTPPTGGGVNKAVIAGVAIAGAAAAGLAVALGGGSKSK